MPLVGNPRRAWLLGAAVAVLALGESGAAFAMFTESAMAGPGSFQTGTLPTPGGLALANGGCSGGAGETNVATTWTGSSTLDASGNYLVAGYDVLRSASSSGPYSSAGSVSGNPPATQYTDTSPAGAAAPPVYVSAGNGATSAQSINSSTYASATVTLSGSVGDEPNALQVTPDGTKLVVAEGAAHQVQIVSTATGTVTSTVSIPAVGSTQSEPTAVAVNPAGTVAWIVDEANARVYPLSLATSSLGSAIAVGTQGDPTAMVVTANGAQVFVADYGSHQVSAINTSTDAVTNIAIGGATGTPIALAATPNSAHVYVADQADSQIDDIATSTDTVTTTLSVPGLADSDFAGGGDPNILAVTPNGAKLYVASYQGGTVADITVGSDTVADTIALPPGGVDGAPDPNALALTPNGCQLYVNDYDNNKVDVYAVGTDTLEGTPAIGDTGDPIGMAATPSGAAVYVANYYDSTVSVISTSTNTVVDTPGTGSGGPSPYAIAIAPSVYYYEVAGTHGGWTSAPSSPAMYALGWDVGGWQ
ncbi:MAG: YncE family protein [Candidatus Dormibacteria bacterium]